MKPRIKTIIIDDEPDARDLLGMLCKSYLPELEIISEAADLHEGVEQVDQIKPELIFLDMNLSNATGFDLLDLLESKPSCIIITTAHPDYAIDAFKYEAVDYLLKPIKVKELKSAVCKVTQKICEEQHEYSGRNKIIIPLAEGYRLLKTEQILRCISDGNYTHVFTADNQSFISSKCLKYFESVLPSSQFERIHHSYLVNIDHVTHYLRSDGGKVQMVDGEKLKVSRAKKDHLLRRLTI